MRPPRQVASPKISLACPLPLPVQQMPGGLYHPQNGRFGFMNLVNFFLTKGNRRNKIKGLQKFSQ
jgi:hypothetical protein